MTSGDGFAADVGRFPEFGDALAAGAADLDEAGAGVPALPDAGASTPAVADALATLTEAVGLLTEALRATGAQVGASADQYRDADVTAGNLLDAAPEQPR